MDSVVIVEIALFILTILFGVIGWLSNFAVTRTLKQIDQNQEKLAQVLSKDIERLNERTDRLECDQAETSQKLANLIGQHDMMMKLEVHEEK